MWQPKTKKKKTIYYICTFFRHDRVPPIIFVHYQRARAPAAERPNNNN